MRKQKLMLNRKLIEKILISMNGIFLQKSVINRIIKRENLKSSFKMLRLQRRYKRKENKLKGQKKSNNMQRSRKLSKHRRNKLTIPMLRNSLNQQLNSLKKTKKLKRVSTCKCGEVYLEVPKIVYQRSKQQGQINLIFLRTHLKLKLQKKSLNLVSRFLTMIKRQHKIILNMHKERAPSCKYLNKMNKGRDQLSYKSISRLSMLIRDNHLLISTKRKLRANLKRQLCILEMRMMRLNGRLLRNRKRRR